MPEGEETTVHKVFSSGRKSGRESRCPAQLSEDLLAKLRCEKETHRWVEAGTGILGRTEGHCLDM